MKRFLITLFLLFSFVTEHQSQPRKSSFITNNAAAIQLEKALPNPLYPMLQNFNCILLGEKHGIKEAALFVERLLDLFSLNKQKVMLGLDLSVSDFHSPINKSSSADLLHSRFFKQSLPEAKNGEALFLLIQHANQMPNVTIFGLNDLKIKGQRDSVMFINLQRQLAIHPKAKFICLTGHKNHSLIQLTNTKHPNTLGCYLKKYFEKKPGKLLSIQHQYQKGRILMNAGMGFKAYPINLHRNVFSASSSYKQYFLVDRKHCLDSAYNGLLYTEQVTPSRKLR
ncbi:MAG: hypothetical protein MI784_10745 [Cytophagales bacterium]|nr:hypothetical protein [Cytophagales bacterium]